MTETWPSCGHSHVSACWYCYLARGEQLSKAEAALKDAERARDAFDEELATRTAQWEDAEARLTQITQERDEARREYEGPMAEEIAALKARLAQVREALRASVEVIRAWHGMGMPTEHEEPAWAIYFNDSPEMLPIRAALAEPAADSPKTKFTEVVDNYGRRICYLAEPAAGAPQGGDAPSPASRISPLTTPLAPASDAAPSSSASGGGARSVYLAARCSEQSQMREWRTSGAVGLPRQRPPRRPRRTEGPA